MHGAKQDYQKLAQQALVGEVLLAAVAVPLVHLVEEAEHPVLPFLALQEQLWHRLQDALRWPEFALRGDQLGHSPEIFDFEFD